MSLKAAPDDRSRRPARIPAAKAPGLAVAACQTPPPRIDLPRADTELTSLLAGDSTLCVRRSAPPVKPASHPAPTRNAKSHGAADHGDFFGTQAESLAMLTKNYDNADSGDDNMEANVADEVVQTSDRAFLKVQHAWPLLPRAAQAAILALIDATLQ